MNYILWVASLLVPANLRGEWLAEWVAELWHVPVDQRLRFCLGAFRDGLWLRKYAPRLDWWNEAWPLSAALFALAFALISQEDLMAAWRAPSLSLFVVALTLAISPVAVPWPMQLRDWNWFLLLKLILAVSVSFFGIDDSFILGHVLAMRWAVMDQRRRCPVCLRLLSRPATIGQPSNTVLDWYGTEFMCAKGHGLLYEPELAMLSYQVRRWVTLDDSWKCLFRL